MLLLLGDPFIDTRFAGAGIGIPPLPAQLVPPAIPPAWDPAELPDPPTHFPEVPPVNNDARRVQGRPSTPRHGVPPLRIDVPDVNGDESVPCPPLRGCVGGRVCA